MKKVLEGHMYDTEKAKELGSDSYSYCNDFHWWSETLYRTRSGFFFLHGEGGPLSRYAVTTGQNEWSGGQKIVPMTEKEAREWAEEHLSGEEYEQIFGDPEEQTGLYILVPNSVAQKWAERKAAENLTSPALLEKLLSL